ncbi:helix-turn-helix transcriptional regulator [Brevundimonas sp. NIBR10]|uniref:helix-turn-helix domain-containing protein n=1 Tax=Brevundimonas sp. NIBR10 TaxID=3015997 RepID=UPI0022F1BCAE|nr:helix-turn-helix transcriptional regulator [Brevundimonas sp. NIBR10]
MSTEKQAGRKMIPPEAGQSARASTGKVVHPVDRHVGGRVRLRRMELGQTQTDLARALGVSFQQIQKYETANDRISASKLWSISEALEVDIGYFFEGMAKGPIL